MDYDKVGQMKKRVLADAVGKFASSNKALTDRMYEIRSDRDQLHEIARTFATAETTSDRMFALELWAKYLNKEREQ